MATATARERVRDARVGCLGTLALDGRPHLVPCCFVLDGDVVYSAVDEVKAKTTTALRRLDNLRAHPQVALLVDHYDDDWSALWWVRLDGDARLLDDGPERGRALDALAAKYPQYARAPDSLGAVVAIDVRRWRSWP